MVFSKELDNSLFLILKNDKQNRIDIIKFIKGLPKKLRDNIQNEIKYMVQAHYDYDLIFSPQMSIEYFAKDGSSYSYKYYEDIDELLILKKGPDNNRTILLLSSHNKHIGKFYNIEIKNDKVKKKEYSYGISERKNKKLFFRIDETRNIGVPLIKTVKEEGTKILNYNNLNSKTK